MLVKNQVMGDSNHHPIHDIQLQIMELLKALILKYTQGDSSSVRVEVAEKILVSIHYVMDLYMTSHSTSEEQGSILEEKGVNEIFSQGLLHIKELVNETKALFTELDGDILNVPSEVYTDTFDKALPDFFKNYDFYFSAQDIGSSMDYPLVFDDLSMQGISYINHYLKALQLETEFCHMFTSDEISSLLTAYGRKHRIDIVNAPINLFEITFTNAFFTFLSESPHLHLMLPREHFDKVQASLKEMSLDDVKRFMTDAVDGFVRLLNITQPPLIEYIARYKALLIPRILSALENNTLGNIPVIRENPQDRLVLEKAPMMDDEGFRAVVEELLNCMNSQDKLDILSRTIHSVEDFIDILSADCLFGSELRDAFKILSEIELAVLSLVVFNEDYSSDLHLDAELIQTKILECEVLWQQELLKYIQDFDGEELLVLEEMMKKMG